MFLFFTILEYMPKLCLSVRRVQSAERRGFLAKKHVNGANKKQIVDFDKQPPTG